jgi:glyoxylase-like metal-dependent hydrolase (beta-lactamase superfamily II)
MKIVDRWFVLTRLGHGVTMLTEPHVHDVWRSNIWHVRGRDADLLVDSGMGLAPLRQAMAELIDKPVIAVASHRHSDHIGGLHEFETRLGHAADAAYIASPPPATLSTTGFPQSFKRQMADDGHPFGPYLIDALPHPDYDLDAYAIEPAPLSRLIGEGDTVDLGDRVLEVLHLPGHTPGCVGLWERETGILFSGDAIYDGLLFDFLPESDIADYVRTMRRLRDLPVTIVHGGHEPSFGRARMLEIIDDYVARNGAAAPV